MKFIILACAIALVAASPAPQAQRDNKLTQVVRDDRDVRPDGYSFAYETDDGVKRAEEGKAVAGDSGALATSGTIEYTLPDGQIFVLKFVADENGYRPESSFIPTLGRK